MVVEPLAYTTSPVVKDVKPVPPLAIPKTVLKVVAPVTVKVPSTAAFPVHSKVAISKLSNPLTASAPEPAPSK